MNNISSAAEYYKDVLKQDNTHVEAIACIGSNHFYSDQPEIALRFYRYLYLWRGREGEQNMWEGNIRSWFL